MNSTERTEQASRNYGQGEKAARKERSYSVFVLFHLTVGALQVGVVSQWSPSTSLSPLSPFILFHTWQVTTNPL